MKKIVSLLLVFLTGLMITGCSLPSPPEDDGPQFCVEKSIWVRSYDIEYGDYAKYKSEFLRQTHCSKVEGCNGTAIIQVCE